jgi:lysozyme
VSDPVDLAVALAVPFVAGEEKFRALPYLDSAKKPTIGYGRRIPSMKHAAVTEPDERALMAEGLEARGRAILHLSPVLATEPAYRLAALMSFAYNAGTDGYAGSTLRRKIAARDWDGAAHEFDKWVYIHDEKGRAVKLNGLVNRRAREAALFRGMMG